MARMAVEQRKISIRLACQVFSISESCYRYHPKRSDENAEIADMAPDEQALYQRLGQRVADRRRAAGYTQVQLAETLGIAQQTLAHYEGARLRMSVALLARIAETLAVGVEELIGEEEGSAGTRKRRGPESKLARQIEQVRQLPGSQQQFVSQMIDTVLQQQRGQDTARQKTGG